MDAEQRHIAGERTRWRLRVAGGQPRKTGEHPGAQALGQHPQGGEEQGARPVAGRGKANEERAGQRRVNRQHAAEQQRRQARQRCRHAAKDAEADIDPGDAGQELAKAIGGGDQRTVADLSLAADYRAEQAEEAAEAQPVGGKPADRRKSDDTRSTEQAGAEAAPAQAPIQNRQPPANARRPAYRCAGCRRATPGNSRRQWRSFH
jgi:hypothetical protein